MKLLVVTQNPSLQEHFSVPRGGLVLGRPSAQLRAHLAGHAECHRGQKLHQPQALFLILSALS